MKITYGYAKRELSLGDALRKRLDGNDYGRGELETLRAEIDNLTTLIVVLFEHAHKEGSLQPTLLEAVLGSEYEIDA